MAHRFEVGKTVAGILIQKHSVVDNDNYFHEYSGIWVCCGKPVTMKHRALTDRVYVGRTVCRECARKLKLGKPNPRPQKFKEPTSQDANYNVPQPDWKPTNIGLAKVRCL